MNCLIEDSCVEALLQSCEGAGDYWHSQGAAFQPSLILPNFLKDTSFLPRMRKWILEQLESVIPSRMSTPRSAIITVWALDYIRTFQSEFWPETPKNPIVLAHGLLGFDELRLAGKWLPGVHYWRGIKDALTANGVEVITASVPASGSIEQRAAKLSDDILHKARGKSVNIIAYVENFISNIGWDNC